MKSRRSFLWKAGAVPAAMVLGGCSGGGGGAPGGASDGKGGGTGGGPGGGTGGGNPAPVLTRPSATSAAGQAMLAKYATVVNQMRTMVPESSPTSWRFQWYTHSVPVNAAGDSLKMAELNRLYPMPGPQRMLADEMWETCEAHRDSTREDYFLPWHRMYLLRFEQIVRKHLGDPNWVLPYWNYSVDGPAHGVIPAEFRMGTLMQSNREPGVNMGVPIDQNAPGALDLTALGQGAYANFGAELDGGVHGAVHVLTGNETNMGQVPFAANDPIFWLHHCNIDRLWASWNRNGGKNPRRAAWMNESFVFADADGNRAPMTCGQVTDIAALNYTYDAFEPAPPGFVPQEPEGVPEPESAVTGMMSQPSAVMARNVTLGTGVARVALRRAGGGVADFGARNESMPEARKLQLVLRNLSAARAPGVLYGVYVNLPANAANRELYRAGYVHFFDATGDEGHSGASPRLRRFDITAMVRRQAAAAGAMEANPTITIIPMGRAAANAGAAIGEVAIVEQ